MTVAVCLKCGSFKHGAVTACKICGATPSNSEELVDSVALTDHYYDRQALEYFSAEIKAGKKALVDPTISAKILTYMKTEAGMRMTSLLQNIAGIQRKEPVNKGQQIAERLIFIESNHPGTVRIMYNRARIHDAVSVFKQMGFKKPFFTSGHRFVVSTVLSSIPALANILPVCLLAGPRDSNYFTRLWVGTGRFAGAERFFKLKRFSGAQEYKVLIFHIEPFYDKVSDLLEEPTE